MKVGSDKSDSGNVKGSEGPGSSGPSSSGSEFSRQMGEIQRQQNFQEIWQSRPTAPPPKREPGPAEPKKKKNDKDDKKKKKTGEGPAQKKLGGPNTGALQNLGQSAAHVGHAERAGGGTSVEKIISIFESNPMYGSNVAQIQVSQVGAEAQIAVTLQNGVMVQVNVTGGNELNIEIHGITAAAQSAMDNPENQLFLRQKLAEQGFIIHKLQTFRGDQAATPAGATPLQPKLASEEVQQPPTQEREEESAGEDKEEEEKK